MNIKKIAALCLASAMVVSVFTGCGANKVVATTNTGITAEYDLVNFMCRYQQAYGADFYAMYYGVSDWTQEVSSGVTLGDSAKENVMSTLHELLTIEQHAAEVGVALTADEEAAIKKAATDFLAGNSKKALKELGANEEVVTRYLTLITLRAKAYNNIIAGADTNVSDEDANMSKYTMLAIAIDQYIDYSTYSYVAYTEEEVAARTKDAADIFAAITDPSELESVAETYGYSATSNYYDKANTSLDETVKSTLDSLKEGEMSELITTDNAFYIVRLDARTDAEQTESNRQSIISDRQQTLYDDTLAGWQENDEWTVKEKALEKINFKNTFTLVEETEASTEVATEAGTEQ